VLFGRKNKGGVSSRLTRTEDLPTKSIKDNMEPTCLGLLKNNSKKSLKKSVNGKMGYD